MNPYYLYQLLDGVQIIGGAFLALGGFTFLILTLLFCTCDDFKSLLVDKRFKVWIITSLISVCIGVCLLMFVPDRYTYQDMQRYKMRNQIEQSK
jgi:hypothetical protein